MDQIEQAIVIPIRKEKMMTLSLLFNLSAFGGDAYACDPMPLRPDAVFPVDGATDVPLDSAIVGIYGGGVNDGNCCEVIVSVDDVPIEGSTEMACNSSIAQSLYCQVSFIPNSPLTENTEYVVFLNSWDEPISSSFTAGTSNSSTTINDPGLNFIQTQFIEYEEWCDIDAHYFVQMQVTEATPTSAGKRKAESGKRKAESAKRKAESGKRKAQSGKRKAQSGKRKAESGKRKAAA